MKSNVGKLVTVFMIVASILTMNFFYKINHNSKNIWDDENKVSQDIVQNSAPVVKPVVQSPQVKEQTPKIEENISVANATNEVKDNFTTQDNTQVASLESEVPQLNKVITNVHDKVNEINTEAVTKNSGCMIFGPIPYDNKNTVDNLFTTAKISQNVYSIIERPVYEIYWNLGSDKIKAINLFEKQKNYGALQDEKYKLILDNNQNWIVSISQVTADEEVAHKLATDLALAAEKYKLGGKWQFRSKSVAYFYHINNTASIPSEVYKLMEKTFNVAKSSCK